jgi:predicted RNA-binding Zn ribbon-like protein
VLALPPDQTSSTYGGRLCFALVNSVLWRRGPAPVETLDSYSRLLDLAAATGWMQDVETLRVAAKRDPAPAQLVLARTLELREALYELFSAAAAREALPSVPVSKLNDTFGQGLSQIQLVPAEIGVLTGWRSPIEPNLPLWLTAVSAADVLTSPAQERIKQCPGERCGWVFLDTTRNRSRRWCEDSQCGNRDRARRYYERRRAS